jgi:hypothetical protein
MNEGRCRIFLRATQFFLLCSRMIVDYTSVRLSEA